MHLRANTFFSTLFVSLLFIASTFAIPIRRDSNSVSDSHDILLDAQSAKLVDRDVVPQSIDARADPSPSSSQSTPSPTMPLEAQVTLSGSPLSEEDRAALKSAIEKMLNLKAALSLFKGSVVDLLKDTRPKLNIKAVKNVKEIPVTVIDYEPSSGKKSTSNTEYQFKFTFAGKPAGPDTTFDFGGYYFSGFIERASLSNGGKQLTGSFYGRDTETGSWNKLVWFTAGQGKVRGHFTDLLDCWAAEWVQIKKKLGMGKNLQNLARCPGHFLG